MRNVWATMTGVGIVLAWPALAVAGDATLAGGETVSLAMALVKVVISLAVVILLLVIAVNLIKRLGIGQGRLQGGGCIRVLESRMIAPKKYVTVVEIGGEYLALGVTDQNINLLGRLDGPPAARTTQAPEERPSFRAMLAGARNRRSDEGGTDDAQ